MDEAARAALLNDLAEAIAEAVRENDIQCLRARIQTGNERFAIALRYKGGSLLPTVSPGFAEWFTGHVIAETQASVKEMHREVLERKLKPSAIRLDGPPVIAWVDGSRCYVTLRLSNPGPRPLRVFFRADWRQLANSQFMMVLDGGGVAGGICFAWLTDSELSQLHQADSELDEDYAARVAPLILRHHLNYRWLLLRSPLHRPDLLRQHFAELNNSMADAYVLLTDQERGSLREVLTYSQWPKWPLVGDQGEEYLRIMFDEHGNASQVFVRGKPIQPPNGATCLSH